MLFLIKYLKIFYSILNSSVGRLALYTVNGGHVCCHCDAIYILFRLRG